MKLHFSEGSLIAVSGSVAGGQPIIVVEVDGTALNHADLIMANIDTDLSHGVLWCTPAQNSLTSKSLLRLLNTDHTSLEWGPSLLTSDRPDVEAVIEDLSCALGKACSESGIANTPPNNKLFYTGVVWSLRTMAVRPLLIVLANIKRLW